MSFFIPVKISGPGETVGLGSTSRGTVENHEEVHVTRRVLKNEKCFGFAGGAGKDTDGGKRWLPAGLPEEEIKDFIGHPGLGGGEFFGGFGAGVARNDEETIAHGDKFPDTAGLPNGQGMQSAGREAAAEEGG